MEYLYFSSESNFKLKQILDLIADSPYQVTLQPSLSKREGSRYSKCECFCGYNIFDEADNEHGKNGILAR